MFDHYHLVGKDIKFVLNIVCNQIISPTPEPILINTLNPHSYVVAQSDHSFQAALQSSQLLLVDGIGIVLAQLVINRRLLKRICGPDFFISTLKEISKLETTINIGFIASDEKLINSAVTLMEDTYQNINVLFRYAPPYEDEFGQEVIDEIKAKTYGISLDILWICVGAPKQEKLGARLREVVDAKIISGVGAALGFYTGDDNRAPLFLRKIGLEWVYRSFMNPARLGRRNLMSNPKFIVYLVKYLFLRRM